MGSSPIFLSFRTGRRARRFSFRFATLAATAVRPFFIRRFRACTWQDYEEDLEEMAQHPVNLNTATREELERMPFLTASQVEDILFYIYRYGQLKSMSELTLISSIGWYQRQLMNCFFYVADDGSKPAFPSLKTIAQYGKHEVMGMLKVPFYERKGDASGTDGYLGYPYKHGLRYQFRYGNSVKLGFVASQDAGEPFFGGRNTMGYDFYSFYLQVKNLADGRISPWADTD